MNSSEKNKLEKINESLVKNKFVYGAGFHVQSGDNSTDIISYSGNMNDEHHFYIASINKFILSSITLRLDRAMKINLDDKISKYVPEKLLNSLLIINGKDYSGDITIRHLISNTSGLPCYLTDKISGQPSEMINLLSGRDRSWSIEEVIDYTKMLKPKFIPGTKNKAAYSDTNFRLLDVVLESVLDKSIKNILTDLFREIGLNDTFVISESNNKFAPIYVKDKLVTPIKFFTSTGQDIVSTVHDLTKFTKLFFSGYFYPVNKIDELKKWNRIFYPFKYGVGIQKFELPAIFNLFKKFPDVIGHCGSTGTITFYIPQKDLYVSGCVNQTHSPGTIFRTLMKIINSY